MTVRIPLAALLVLSVAMLGAPPAGAVDDSKPATSCYGTAFTDKKGDAIPAAPTSQDGDRGNLDLLDGFYKFDQAKADQATTFNIHVVNLSTNIPQGDTALSWYVSYGQADGDPWVRALTDFTGVVSYEYGHYSIVGPQTQSVRDGATEGKFFEGPDGVIQLVFPATGPGKPGTTLKSATITANEAVQVLPGASPTPAKGGLLYVSDTASTKGTWTVGSPCPATPPSAPAPSTGAAPPPQQLNSGAGPLPVKLATTKLKAAKAKGTIALKLSSSEAITKLGAQLKGTGKTAKKVFGKGALAKLDGNGTLKVKVKGKLKKGGYQLELVGTDAQGARRFAAAKLTVR